MAVFLAEVQPVDTPPDRLFFALDCPGASPVWGTALTEDQEFRQGVFAGISALFYFGTYLLNFPLACAPGQFFLRPTKSSGINDGRVVIFDEVHGPGLAVVAPDFFADTVYYIGFIEASISSVFFI